MKNLILSAIFALVAFSSNAQTITISGFGTKEKFGPVNSNTEFDKVLLDGYEAFQSEGMPVSYKYVINFNSLECTLYDGNGEIVSSGPFKIINKNSDRDFQIQFTDPTLDDLGDTYGIIVKDTIAAHTQYNGKAVSLTIFDALYIF